MIDGILGRIIQKIMDFLIYHKNIIFLNTMSIRKIRLEKSLQLKKKFGEIYERTKELSHLNMLYFGTPNPVIETELKKKLSSYKQQDRAKKKQDADKFITMEGLVEKLVESKLNCHYCREDMHITGDKKRDKKQWTLDRIDNKLGHWVENVVIACLECNLNRRCIDKDKFLFTKRLKVEKKG